MKLSVYDRFINDLILIDIKDIVKYYKTCKNNYNDLNDFMRIHHIDKHYKQTIIKYMEVIK